MRTFSLDERGTVFAFRGVVFLALVALLLHSPRVDSLPSLAPFALAAFYLFTAVVLLLARSPILRGAAAQAAAYVWDVAVISALVYSSEGFDDELYMMYFLIMFMAGVMGQARHGLLVGTLASLAYAGLWARGKAGADLPLANLLLRLAFFQAVAFFTAFMAERARAHARRARTLELRLALGRLANGGWGTELEEDMDPELAKTVHTVNRLVDNLTLALRKTLEQNERLRETAATALLQLAREKERLGAVAASSSAGRSPASAPRG